MDRLLRDLVLSDGDNVVDVETRKSINPEPLQKSEDATKTRKENKVT
jgi:hypothetical protein